jgi:hypothetical protein
LCFIASQKTTGVEEARWMPKCFVVKCEYLFFFLGGGGQKSDYYRFSIITKVMYVL